MFSSLSRWWVPRRHAHLTALRSLSFSNFPPPPPPPPPGSRENNQQGENAFQNAAAGRDLDHASVFRGRNSGPMNFGRDFMDQDGRGPRGSFQQGDNAFQNFAPGRDFDNGSRFRGSSGPVSFVRGILDQDERGNRLEPQFNFPIRHMENNADVVHIKMMRNNTFVTVTDSKGNKKLGASSGSVPEMKGGAKLSRYAAEATAEYVGRMSRNYGVKSVVMKVKGFTYFKKKKTAILSWKDGFTNSKVGQNPVIYVEDTTRKPHNGCRLRKQRRV